MVFVIQHRQSRQQVATQRKLDEILRALPPADNALIALEEASDDALAAALNAPGPPSRRGRPPRPTHSSQARPPGQPVTARPTPSTVGSRAESETLASLLTKTHETTRTRFGLSPSCVDHARPNMTHPGVEMGLRFKKVRIWNTVLAPHERYGEGRCVGQRATRRRGCSSRPVAQRSAPGAPARSGIRLTWQFPHLGASGSGDRSSCWVVPTACTFRGCLRSVRVQGTLLRHLAGRSSVHPLRSTLTADSGIGSCSGYGCRAAPSVGFSCVSRLGWWSCGGWIR